MVNAYRGNFRLVNGYVKNVQIDVGGRSLDDESPVVPSPTNSSAAERYVVAASGKSRSGSTGVTVQLQLKGRGSSHCCFVMARSDDNTQ